MNTKIRNWDVTKHHEPESSLYSPQFISDRHLIRSPFNVKVDTVLLALVAIVSELVEIQRDLDKKSDIDEERIKE